ncbi:MAG TPA: DMT family transporter [Williamwhitmania sp.]|nr:DMT family transporter [Williamwhitmania sp.]
MKPNTRAYIYGGFTVLFWGTSASAFKIGLQQLSFIQLLFLANLTSVFILLGFLIYQGKLLTVWPTNRKDWGYSALLGLLNPFGYYLILLKAYTLLPAQVAQPLNFVWPVVLVFLAVPILGRKLSGWSILSLLISFVGVAVISSQGKLTGLANTSLLGVFLALFSSLLWALFWVFNVKDRRAEEEKLFLNFLFSLIYLIAISPFIPDFYIINTGGIWAGVYVGFFEMGVAFLFWLKALSCTTSTDKLGNIIYLVPFLSLVFIHFVVGETIFWTTFAGLCLIVFSVVFQQVMDKRINRRV